MTAKLYRGAVLLAGLGTTLSVQPALGAHPPNQGAFSLQAPTESPRDFPLPPIPPASPPLESAAPMPGSPTAPKPETPHGAQLSPGFFAPGVYGTGNGYLAGSTSQNEVQRRSPPAGFKLNVPLQ